MRAFVCTSVSKSTRACMHICACANNRRMICFLIVESGGRSVEAKTFRVLVGFCTIILHNIKAQAQFFWLCSLNFSLVALRFGRRFGRRWIAVSCLAFDCHRYNLG